MKLQYSAAYLPLSRLSWRIGTCPCVEWPDVASRMGSTMSFTLVVFERECSGVKFDICDGFQMKG